MNLTERIAINAIMRPRYAQSTCVVPNYTPRHWWECDVFEVTRSGYFVEYEVKLSFADFVKDRQKMKEGQYRLTAGRYDGTRDPGIKKHDQLTNRAAGIPSRFWYVCEQTIATQIVSKMLLPEWAGLISMWMTEHGTATEQIVEAPKLHSEKIDQKIIDHAYYSCYWRMHRLIHKIKEEENVPTGIDRVGSAG